MKWNWLLTGVKETGGVTNLTILLDSLAFAMTLIVLYMLKNKTISIKKRNANIEYKQMQWIKLQLND